ncbi:bifunctional methylenetetrahydrofolate dehydrogenase/methenyltetrahydrofolate cyclohydrolase FolD [Alphaproteobacteria bacterium]|nr:bifunctional methylenetetrahydrofolate dehydrogenase/methenyltetrahydrofolate cyclohydrolase FolD [Alphaproteobacteria bacterium]
MTKIIDGKEFAQKIRNQVKEDSDRLLQDHKVQPCLAVVLVGENPASRVYVGAKTKMAAECNIKTKDFKMEDTTDQATLLKVIEELNNDSNVHGILVQLPLPKQIDERAVIDAIDVKKDVDGFHAINAGRLSIGGEMLKQAFIPCTPLGSLLLLKNTVPNLSGMNAVVIGRSNIVGKPMSQLLIEESCTVTVVHSRTKDIEALCSKADIIVAAVGRPEMIKSNWIKDGAVIIDVGINRVPSVKSDGSEGSKLVGDVDYKDVFDKCSAITPVPGGVGPMTIACLLRNTVTSAYRHSGENDPRSTTTF